MTFRQIIGVLWQRRLLIVAVILVAMVTSAAYLALQVKSYSSTVDVRTSRAVTNGSSGGEFTGLQVDFDPTTLTSPKLLQKVATATGSTETDIAKSITFVLQENTVTNTLVITAVGPTPTQAQERANTMVKVYTAYLQSQIDNALQTLITRQAATNALAVQYQQETNANLRNSIAAANLNNALADLGTLNTQIQSIKNVGSPLTALTDAPLGTSVGPGTAIVLAIALAAGLIAGIGLALLRDQFDNRLRGEYEIEHLTGLPSLGELSFDTTLRRKHDSLPAAHGEQTQLSEGLRSLRTSIQVLLPRNNAVIVMTSVDPGDGKTFVTANIALAWARTGKKVIVVDGDLRRPTLSTYFDEAAEGLGLSDVLRGATNPKSPQVVDQIKRYLSDTKFTGLRVLPAGFEASDPADLLATASLKEIIEALRACADIIVFDSPPAMGLIDASLLAEYADGVVVIASVNRTDRSSLATTVDLLKQNGAVTLGVVANRSRRRLPKTYAPYYIQAKSQRHIARVAARTTPSRAVDDDAIPTAALASDDVPGITASSSAKPRKSTSRRVVAPQDEDSSK
ncbi:MAG: polysaccharide biosynthesis tyrosine autokinase [Lacisediminihabitans sp.]